MVCYICHMTKKRHSINYIPLSHHDPSWYPMKSHEISIFSDTPRSIQVYPVLIHPHSYCHFGSSLQAPSDTAWQNVSWAVTTGGSENGHSQFFTLYVFHRENAFFLKHVKNNNNNWGTYSMFRQTHMVMQPMFLPSLGCFQWLFAWNQ